MIMYIEYLKGCNELIRFLINSYNTIPAITGTVLFQ